MLICQQTKWDSAWQPIEALYINNYSMSPRCIRGEKKETSYVAPSWHSHLVSKKGKWDSRVYIQQLYN